MTLLEMTLSGTAMILAGTILRALALRRLPKGTFAVLWWLTALRLLAPVRLPSRFSVYTLLEALRPKAAAVPAATPRVPVRVAIVPGASGAAPVPAPAPFPVWTAVWLAGAALLGVWFLVRYVRWRRRFRESLPAVGLAAGADACLSYRREVRLRVTDRIGAPLTYGLLRPVILLPKTLDLADRETVSCVLAHEMSHIRRLDGLFKLALAAALCLHWFNPAVWLLYILANRDMELRCDEAAVLSLGEDSRERYALALIRLAELQNECVPLCGFSHKSGMEERIKAIMSIKKQSMLACFIALALVLGITTAFATSAKPQEADRPNHEDIIDGDLLAASSAESAALWAETLAPYEPFGLEWVFDDPDLDGNGLTMTWEGHEVCGIYDETAGIWITEHTGNGAYGPDAVELYTVYENGALTGLRLATEAEQKQFDRERQMSADALKVHMLGESVRYDSGHIYFTIPESDETWSIFISGRILLDDGSGQSVHYLEEESEKAEWVPRMTYSFEVADAAYDELNLDVRYGNADFYYDLTMLLPEGNPLAAEPLPEGKADVPAGAEMIWPVDGGEIANGFGKRYVPGGAYAVNHDGVDIGGMEKGAPIYAAASGTVKEAGFNAQDGNFVRLDHGNGLETFYAHCRSVEVKTGEAVELGQTIAAVGNTGNSTGPHLHFEILMNGTAQDPERCFRSGVSMGTEGNTDLTAGVLKGRDDRIQSASGSDAERSYAAGNLPGFHMAFSRLDEKEQSAWMERIYADGKISFFSACQQLSADSPLIGNFAERLYQDDSISFFSVLADSMSEPALDAWLDRAVRDDKFSFQLVLLDKLGREEEEDALEEKLAEQQMEEYRKAGVTKNGKNYYFEGRLVNVFLDARPDSSFYRLDMNPAGEVNIKIIRGADGQITGVEYMTDSELTELFGESF